MRVGVLTGGGDCPGLNAVIRAIVRKAERVHNDEVVGFIDGWSGVLEDRWMPLDIERCREPRGTERGIPTQRKYSRGPFR